MNRRFLYWIAALLWGVPGIIICAKGIKAYVAMPKEELWWLLLITVAVLISFNWMFYRIVRRYCCLIAAQPERTHWWSTFPFRGWILLVCMSCLGVALKFMPFIPLEFTASFYCGLGPSLVVASILFVAKSKHENELN